MTGTTPAISVDGFGKTFGAVTAVHELSFTVGAGEVVGFLGPNAAGKTTTLRAIGGLIRATSGTVRLLGRSASDPRARAALGYMPADPLFATHLSGNANLELLRRLHGEPAGSAGQEALDALGLSDQELRRPVSSYSSGMRQKLAIAAALQSAPEVVVLDEPANRLDPIAHRAFCELIRARAAAGGAVLLSSHVLGEVEEVCDRVVLIRRGRLLRVASTSDLRQQASRKVTLTYSAPPATAPTALRSPLMDGVTVTGWIPPGRPDLIRALLADETIVDVTVDAPSLEEVFLGLYERAS